MLSNQWAHWLTNHCTLSVMKKYKWGKLVLENLKNNFFKLKISTTFNHLVARIAKEQIEPHVKTMENLGDVLPEIREIMFNNGVSWNA